MHLHYPALLRFPTWALNPLLMAPTDLREPHDWQLTKSIRCSFSRSVSGDLHVLHVTYSTVEAAISTFAEALTNRTDTHRCTA